MVLGGSAREVARHAHRHVITSGGVPDILSFVTPEGIKSLTSVTVLDPRALSSAAARYWQSCYVATVVSSPLPRDLELSQTVKKKRKELTNYNAAFLQEADIDGVVSFESVIPDLVSEHTSHNHMAAHLTASSLPDNSLLEAGVTLINATCAARFSGKRTSSRPR
jgi:hypothetical protein